MKGGALQGGHCKGEQCKEDDTTLKIYYTNEKILEFY